MNAETSRAVSAEFLGTLVFCFLANTSQSAMGVGIAYAVSSEFYSNMSAHASRAFANIQGYQSHLQASPSTLCLVPVVLPAAMLSHECSLHDKTTHTAVINPQFAVMLGL